jgi:hypothetical protein
MADTVRSVEYYYVTVSDEPGEGQRIFSALQEGGVNLLAVLGFPLEGGRSQIDLVPEDPESLMEAAAAARIHAQRGEEGVSRSGRRPRGGCRNHREARGRERQHHGERGRSGRGGALRDGPQGRARRLCAGAGRTGGVAPGTVKRLPAAILAPGRDPPSERALLLYLDQNYLSGIVKGKAAFRELEPTLRTAVARGAVAVPESEAHRIESAARPDLPLLELLRELSAGLTLPDELGPLERQCGRRLVAVLDCDFPERRTRASDQLDIRALAVALPRCRLVTCDAFMADVVRRAGLDVRFRCELFTGRRADVERLTRRLERLATPASATTSRYSPPR